MTRQVGKWLTYIVAALATAGMLTACGDEDGVSSSTSPESLEVRSKKIRGRDRTVPVISITSPAATGDYTSTEPIITLAGRSKDNNLITGIGWRSDQGDAGTAQGTSSWSAQNLPLYPGNNVFTVTAHDAAGNSSDAVIVVTYVPEAQIPVTNETPVASETLLTNETPVASETPLTNETPVTSETPDEQPLAVNQPPVIAGQPRTAVAQDEAYSFIPTASDPEGAQLTFSINNQPEWADFDRGTGALTGVPQQADAGTTYGISITVSDGPNQVDLLPFDLTVEQVVLGSVTLSWTPPTENVDGTALQDLAGYKIRYGSSPGNYSDTIVVDNPGVSRYMVDNLSPNNWYFIITAYDMAGHESEATDETFTTIQ